MKQTRRNVTTIRVAKQLYRYVLFRRKQQQKNKTATSDCESDCVHGNCEKAGGECVCSPDQWRPGHKTRYWQNLSYVGEHCDQSKVFCVLCFSDNSTFFFFFSELECSQNCRGKCIQHNCVCEYGFVGVDCSIGRVLHSLVRFNSIHTVSN